MNHVSTVGLSPPWAFREPLRPAASIRRGPTRKNEIPIATSGRPRILKPIDSGSRPIAAWHLQGRRAKTGSPSRLSLQGLRPGGALGLANGSSTGARVRSGRWRSDGMIPRARRASNVATAADNRSWRPLYAGSQGMQRTRLMGARATCAPYQALSFVSAARSRNTMRRDEARPIASSFSSCVIVRDTVSIVRPK
jgi:hypothetical protein